MNEETGLLHGQGGTVARNRCRPSQKLCYGLGHVYNDLCASVWFSYTLFYFQIVLQMDSTTAGTLIMIGQVADSLATPVAGWAVDSLGAPRAWHMTGTVLVTVGFTLIFALEAKPFVFYASLIIIFQIGWALVQIAHLTIITIIAESNKHSSDLTAIRYTATVCCNVFVYLLTWEILKNAPEGKAIGPYDFNRFKEIILITTAIGVISSMFFYCGIDVRRPRNENNTIETRNFLKTLVIYQVSVMYMSARLYSILNLIYIPLYLNERITKYNQESDSIRSSVAIIPLICFLTSFITSIILKYRPNVLSDKMIYLLGIVVALIACLWIAFGVSASNAPIYAIACLIGIGSSFTLIASLCLTAKIVSTNGFKGGSVYSTVTFTDKLVTGLLVFLIQNL
ncbi:PREDICTED: major facilitator superfamily domain-containing protein 12-like [Nicrophorus vespilloides]|uniref:Major facilitator superfamily domain-containing protein 12-like n=1 Tax=Nicrophorus vespilloides TaxID=110193 RepID=A0ABM1M3K0_NICVS|nr:PREDICTED: major facilitator superfamily domain-containing protein 12-like [Nicrophorus vespilloides]